MTTNTKLSLSQKALKTAKLIRVDKDKQQVYVWCGGEYIHIHKLGEQIDTVEVRSIISQKMPSFSQVKERMREMMINENR